MCLTLKPLGPYLLAPLLSLGGKVFHYFAPQWPHLHAGPVTRPPHEVTVGTTWQGVQCRSILVPSLDLRKCPRLCFPFPSSSDIFYRNHRVS